MKKLFTLLLVASCAMGLKAQGTFALAEGDAPLSGDQVTSVPNITMTYSEAGGNDWKAAVADNHIDEGAVFGAYTAGNGTNGNQAGGTFVTFQPVNDGCLTVAIVCNADKKFYVEEDGVALEEFNGKVYSEKYYGVETFAVVGGKTYKVYAAGSKMGFYGFTYDFEPVEQGYGFAGAGTEEDPYLLTSAADFASLAANINAENTGAGEYFQLAGDIDFAGTALPMIALDAIKNVNTVAYGFEGVIDGAGYTISGVKHEQPSKDDPYGSYVGLVSSLGENGVIKNLTIEGEISAYMYVSPFAGLSCGTIENCVNKAAVSNAGAYGAGITGGLIQGKGIVRNCENYGTVSATSSYACGICGFTQRHNSIESYDYVIESCNNYAEITSTNVGAGGIAGTFCGLIYDCTNEGEVKAAGQYAGGILACANNEAVTLKKCNNQASVTGSSKVGGIVGELRHETALVDGCYNAGYVEDFVVYGSITGTDADESKVKNVGGIVGNSTKDGATIKHCASLTAVTVPASVETAGHLIGAANIIVDGDCCYFAPDATLPLDDETLAVEKVEDVVFKWYEPFKGTMVVSVMGQEITLPDQSVYLLYSTSDLATVTIPEITYGGYEIYDFNVDVPYTATEDGYTFSCGEFTAQAGEYAINGTSIEGVQRGNDLTLTTVFTVGNMPMPMTVTFNGVKDGTETSIEAIEAVKTESGARYDLQGRRINGESGLFIENGKIFFVR